MKSIIVIIYYGPEGRTLDEINETCYFTGSSSPDRKSVVNTVLSMDDALNWSPVSVTFEEFTKHFLIVNFNGLAVVGIPENQEELYWKLRSYSL